LAHALPLAGLAVGDALADIVGSRGDELGLLATEFYHLGKRLEATHGDVEDLAGNTTCLRPSPDAVDETVGPGEGGRDQRRAGESGGAEGERAAGERERSGL